MNTKVSVLITTYNLEDYIGQTLESVLMQEVDFEIEILVGDDGSSDKTVEVVKSWQDKYPDIIKYYVMDREPDKKYNKIERASKNRINLIKHAKGEYLVFLDGDDFYVDSKKLKKQVSVLDNPDNSDCIACVHDIYMYWNEEKKYRVNDFDREFKIDGRSIWKDCIYFSSDTLLFRNIFKGEFPKDINPSYYDDNVISFYLFKYGKFYYIPETMVCYRQLETSSWNSVNELEKSILNLTNIDIEEKINESYKKESEIRYMRSVFYVWKNRKRIPGDMYDKYYSEAEENDLTYTMDKLSFNRKNAVGKLKENVSMICKLFGFTFIKLTRPLRLRKYR